MTGIIDDGYTRDDGYVAADPNAPNPWKAVSFTYRPATRMENIKLDSEVRIALINEDRDQSCAAKAEQLACEFVAKHLVSWDLLNSNGAPVPTNGQACARMVGELFGRIYRIIRGIEASDKRPDAESIPLTDEANIKN